MTDGPLLPQIAVDQQRLAAELRGRDVNARFAKRTGGGEAMRPDFRAQLTGPTRDEQPPTERTDP